MSAGPLTAGACPLPTSPIPAEIRDDARPADRLIPRRDLRSVQLGGRIVALEDQRERARLTLNHAEGSHAAHRVLITGLSSSNCVTSLLMRRSAILSSASNSATCASRSADLETIRFTATRLGTDTISN